MTKIVAGAVGACVLAVLAGCVQPPAPPTDPFGIACRERATDSTGVTLAEAQAVQTDTDALGNRIYSVSAGGVSFRCTVDDAAFVTQFARL